MMVTRISDTQVKHHKNTGRLQYGHKWKISAHNIDAY